MDTVDHEQSGQFENKRGTRDQGCVEHPLCDVSHLHPSLAYSTANPPCPTPSADLGRMDVPDGTGGGVQGSQPESVPTHGPTFSFNEPVVVGKGIVAIDSGR